MATVTAKRVYANQPTQSYGTVYTVPANKSFIIKEIIIANTTAYNATVTISVVTSGGTAGGANNILTSKVIPPNDVVILSLSTAMATGDFIACLQGTLNACTIQISGVEIG